MMELKDNIAEHEALGFTTEDVKKIGYLMTYLSDKIPALYITKLLKLLFIIDERSVQKTGSPITFLNYEAWHNGPVARSIHQNLTYHEASVFNEYIKVERDYFGNRITPVVEFNDDEFSGFDLQIINSVIEDYKTASADELIQLLHLEGTAWDASVKKHGLKSIFDNKIRQVSDAPVELTETIKEDPLKVDYFNYVMEQKEFYNTLV